MLNPCRPSAPSGSRCSSRLGHPQNCDGLPPATPARAPHWPGGRASHTSPLCILLGDSASRNRHTNDRRRLAARPHALWVVSPFTVARPMTLGRRLESVDCRAGDCKAGHSPRRPLAIGTGGTRLALGACGVPQEGPFEGRSRGLYTQPPPLRKRLNIQLLSSFQSGPSDIVEAPSGWYRPWLQQQHHRRRSERRSSLVV